MPIDVLMPALSPTMEKGNLAKWLKKEGDSVKSGDIIAEIETDKATMEVEATDEGTIGKILVPAGTNDVRGQHAHRRDPERRRRQGSIKDKPAAEAKKAEQPEQQEKAAESAAPAKADKAPDAPEAKVATDPDIPEGTETVTMTCAKPCATPWPKKCAATATCS